ncbi:hypothetical protein LTS18_002357, partial [Coniosporium uncinatum]
MAFLKLSLLATTFLFTSTALAQQPTSSTTLFLDPQILPACAIVCPALTQVQATCQLQSNVQSCICSASALSGLQQSTSGLNCPQCQAGDLVRVQNYYNQFCAAQGGVNNGATTTTAAAGGAATTAAGGGTRTASAAASRSATATGTAAAAADNGGGNQTWIQSHYPWVIFLIVLALGLIGFAVLLTWLKRRHQARKAARAGNVAATDSAA